MLYVHVEQLFHRFSVMGVVTNFDAAVVYGGLALVVSYAAAQLC